MNKIINSVNNLWVVILGTLLSISTPLIVMGTSYYVDSVGGNDANAGNAIGAPWQSLARVNNGPANDGGAYLAGDKLLFKSGSVFNYPQKCAKRVIFQHTFYQNY